MILRYFLKNDISNREKILNFVINILIIGIDKGRIWVYNSSKRINDI